MVRVMGGKSPQWNHGGDAEGSLHGGSIYFLAQWRDPTESPRRSPWQNPFLPFRRSKNRTQVFRLILLRSDP
jgi:hypothetical protein